jgi:hypothetical protein
MQIVEPQRRLRPAPKPLNPFLTIDPDSPEDGESSGATMAVIGSEAVVEGVVIQESTAPPATIQSGGPPSNRNDRRNKHRRQRDRKGKPDRPPHMAAPPPLESPPPAMNAPDASPAPMTPPETPPTTQLPADW